MARDSTTFPADSHPQWIRWLLPSVADLIFISIFSLLTFTNLSTRLLGDAGIGWHIRTGQLILSTHTIPHTDPFSSTMASARWFAWEWLYDLIVGWLQTVSGLNGVTVFTAVVIGLTFCLAFRLMVRRGTNLLLALALVLLAASSSMIHFFARPHVFTWLFTVLWFWILDSAERDFVVPERPQRGNWLRNSYLVWTLPLSMLLWVNLHGGFLIGFVLLGIYWLGALWQASRSSKGEFDDLLLRIRSAKRLRHLTWVGVLSFIATLCNPYSIHLYVHIERYLFNRFLMNHIDEFQSPNFHLVAQECFAILLLLALVTLAVRRKSDQKFPLSHALVILFAVYSGLYAARNIPISSLLLIVIIGPLLSGSLRSYLQSQPPSFSRFGDAAQFFNRMQSIELNLSGQLWSIAAVVITCIIVAQGGKFNSQTVINAHFDTTRFPVAAVNYLEQQNVQGAIFSPDSWGGYIVYRLYPRVKVVVDDRHDLYGESFLRSYLQTIHVEPSWRLFLEQHPAQYLLLPRSSALANVLAETHEWRPIYSDDVAVIFAPTHVAAQSQ